MGQWYVYPWFREEKWSSNFELYHMCTYLSDKNDEEFTKINEEELQIENESDNHKTKLQEIAWISVLFTFV